MYMHITLTQRSHRFLSVFPTDLSEVSTDYFLKNILVTWMHYTASCPLTVTDDQMHFHIPGISQQERQLL